MLVAACAASIAAAGACSDTPGTPVTPPPPSAAAFTPLSVGDSWTYHHWRETHFLASNGSDVRAPISFAAESRREIVAVERIAGVDYAVERDCFFVIGSADTACTWRRLRQDDTGLYTADLDDDAPPGSFADLDSLTETRRLAYPVEVGASWELHEGNPSATATVEAYEPVGVPGDVHGAFRVSFHQPGMRALDRRLFWYSACGMLHSQVHAEFTAVDTGTGQMLRVVSDEDVALLASRPRCARPGISP